MVIDKRSYSLDEIDSWCKSNPVHVKHIARYLDPELVGKTIYYECCYLLKEDTNLFALVICEERNDPYPDWRSYVKVHPSALFEWETYCPPAIRDSIKKELAFIEAKNKKAREERYRLYLELKKEFENGL